MIRNMMHLMIVLAAGACAAQTTTHEPTQGDVVDDGIPPSTEAVIRPTPAMLAAALSGDPDAMANAAMPSGCMAPTTCPAQYGSCAGWSSFSQCGLTCLNALCPGGENVRGTLFSNAFRVCFDKDGNSCTEWQEKSSIFCNC
jgi:hypothetical protein